MPEFERRAGCSWWESCLVDVGDGDAVSPPEGFSLRSARDEDAERAAELVNDEARVHLGTPIWSTDQLLRHWSNPVVDRERDLAVVEAPGGEICAWLSVVCRPPHVEVFALGVVGLAWQGRGVGAWVLAETERRAHRFLELAPAGARVVIHAGALADEPAVGALLVAAGYREIRRFQLMRVDFASVLPAPHVPPGIRIDQLDPELDVAAAFDAHHEAFADHWGETEETPEEFRHWLIDTPAVRPRALASRAGWAGRCRIPVRVARRGGGPFARLRRRTRHASSLPRQRDRRGAAEARLPHAARAWQARLRPPRRLGLADGATRLYERVGMTAHPRFATWEKELQPGSVRGS